MTFLKNLRMTIFSHKIALILTILIPGALTIAIIYAIFKYVSKAYKQHKAAQ